MFFIQNIKNEITWVIGVLLDAGLFAQRSCCGAGDGHCCLLAFPVEVTEHAESIGIGLIPVSKSCFSNKYLIQDADRKDSPLDLFP